MKNTFNVTTVLPWAGTFSVLLWRPENIPAQGPHSEVVPRAFWRLVPKSCDECKGSFARGCEAERWSHWTCSSLGTIFQPMRINSIPGVKCFYNNKNVLRAQSMVWHFVHHSVALLQPVESGLQPTLNRHTVRPFQESDDTRGCNNTICPPEDEEGTARNMLRIVM